jgi:hypothetical protein
MSVTEKLAIINNNIESRSYSHPVSIVAVTKYATELQTQAMIDAGCTHLGENNVQNLAEKIERFGRAGLTWHLIGHLQTNKVKKAVALADMIQSVDSLKVLSKIDTECEKIGKMMPVLIQVNVSDDPNKYGFSTQEFLSVLPELFSFSNVDVIGIMTIGPQTTEREGIRQCFQLTRQLKESVQSNYPQFGELSMGMSGDFDIALEEGASIIRVGSFLYK